MPHCYGGGFPDPLFGLPAQGLCGSAKPHDEHDFAAAEKFCPGGVSWAVADCGAVMDHGEHPISQPAAPSAE